MSTKEQRLEDALLKIADVANEAVKGNGYAVHPQDDDPMSEYAPPKDEAICVPKKLPSRLRVKAAETAAKVNPVNSPMIGAFAEASEALIMEPQRIAILTTKYWGPYPRRLPVSFMERTPANLRERIIRHMNEWPTGITFVETQETGVIRISRGGRGYWSYLGTDILHIPRHLPTMNLAGFTMNTPEREYRRVVRHETGHTLGFPHEHMRRELVNRIDPEKAYAYFWRTQGWDRPTVDQQVLTPLDQRSIFATRPDETSIMCYQLPGAITKDGRPILGGMDLNWVDRAFARRIYPRYRRGLLSDAEALQDVARENEMVLKAAAEQGAAWDEEDEWSEQYDIEPEFEVGCEEVGAFDLPSEG